MARARARDERRFGAIGWAAMAVVALVVAFGASRYGSRGLPAEPGSIDGRLASAGAPVPADPPAPEWSAAKPLAATFQATTGVSRALGAGRSCDGATAADDAHLLLETALPAGTLSAGAGTARANLGISGPSSATGPVPSDGPTHRLEPASSHLTLADERGTLRFELAGAGDCPDANLAVDAERRFVGQGDLELLEGTGAYRDAQFAGGSWDLVTTAAPGADNHWRLVVAGSVAALRPGLEVEVAHTEWANVADFLARVVTVDLAVGNPGPGDAYGATLTALSAPAGVTRLTPLPLPLGDLLAGDETVVRVRYQLPLLGQPCFAVILACQFGTTATASLPDALGQPTTRSAGTTVTAPTLPIQL